MTSLECLPERKAESGLCDTPNDLPTYPGVPQAVAIILPSSSVFDNPKSLIIILESSSGLTAQERYHQKAADPGVDPGFFL